MGLLNLVRNAAASPKPSSFWYKRTKNVKKMFHMTAGIWEHSAPCRIRSCDRECFCGKRNLCENFPPTHLKPDQEENTSVKQCSVLLQTEQGSLFADGLTTQLWTKLWNVSVLDCSLIFLQRCFPIFVAMETGFCFFSNKPRISGQATKYSVLLQNHQNVISHQFNWQQEYFTQKYHVLMISWGSSAAVTLAES